MANTVSDSPTNSSMDQVRELLMGTQFKDMEYRIQRQEERFVQEIESLRDTVKSRLESLENFMKSEASSLMARIQEGKAEHALALKNEQRERAEALAALQKESSEALARDRREREEAVNHLSREMSAKEDSLERKLSALSATLDKAEQELRQLLLAEGARLSAETGERYRDALNALSKAEEALRFDLVSRSALSALFTTNAVSLAGDTASAPVTARDAVATEEPDNGSKESTGI